MSVVFNSEKLQRLLSNLYIFAGIQTNIYDKTGQNIQLFGEHTDFCRLINASPEGHRRCVECDCRAAQACAEHQSGYSYRCHAGLNEEILPIISDGEPVAFLAFGQFLDERPYPEQWEFTSCAISWYNGDLAELRDAFFRLLRVSTAKRHAYKEILEVIALYISKEGIITTTEPSDQQRLKMYIDEKYAEKLSLAKICGDLNMGSTKVCALAGKISGGGSVVKMITARRIAEAKTMLLNSSMTVSQIAGRVGFSDYNYFTSVFKKTVGVTPTEYRRSTERESEPSV